jgi:hypothetical protein
MRTLAKELLAEAQAELFAEGYRPLHPELIYQRAFEILCERVARLEADVAKGKTST